MRIVMRFHCVRKLLVACFFFVVSICSSSYGQSFCTGPSVIPTGSFQFGAAGGSLQAEVIAAFDNFNISPPNICGWGSSAPNWIQVQPPGMPFMPGTPNENNVTNATITVDQNLDLAPRSGNVVFTGADHSTTPPTISVSQDASPGDFSLIVSSGFTTITKGFTVSYNIFIARTGGFAGTVCLSVPPPLPQGITAAFSIQCTTGNTSLVTFFTSNATADGTFTAVIQGTNTTVSRFAPVLFTVNDFSISLRQPSVTVPQGGTVTIPGEVIVNPINNFSSQVQIGPENVPSGVGFSFSPNPATTTSDMTVSTNTAAVPGNYTVPIVGVNENQPRLTNLALTVSGFGVSACDKVLVQPGGSAPCALNINKLFGYSGSVNLSVSGLPANVTANFDTNPATASSTMTLNAATGISPGTYLLTITGTDNRATKTTNTTLIIGTTPVASRFVPIAPCRVADTRNADGPFGGPFLPGGTAREFDITSSSCGVPPEALAFSLNITALPKVQLRYMTVYPCGQTAPLVSTLNSDGRIKAVATILDAGSSGAACAYASDDTDVIVDINGYFVDPSVNPTALAFYPMTPCRVVDTRNAAGPLGGPAIAAQTIRTFPILSSTCNIPAAAQAYSLNLTAIPSGPLGYMSIWPAGQPFPTASTLNATTGAITANAAIVGAGTNGDVTVYALNNSDLAIDINGYFAPPGQGGLSFYPATQCRMVDTRNASGGAPVNGEVVTNVTGSGCGLPPVAPATTNAYVVNATVIPPAPMIWMALWPDGTPLPVVSTLNANDGAVNSNMAIVPSTNGSVDAWFSNPTQFLLDISGYFAP